MLGTRSARIAWGLAAVCAMSAMAVTTPSALASPTASSVSSVLAADTSAKPTIPGLDLAKVAAENHTSLSAVTKRQAELAPAIRALTPDKPPTALPKLKLGQVTTAKPDECFQSIGAGGPAPDAEGNCPTGYKPKFNNQYVYGSATIGDWMYYGSVGNIICSGGFTYLESVPIYATKDSACEGPGGPNGRKLGWNGFGDMARFNVTRHNSVTGNTEDITPTDEQAPLLKYGTGMRGVGAKDDVVLMANLTLNTTGTAYQGIALEAFEASTGRHLGETLMPEYFNMRNGTLINGELYFGARLAGAGTGAGGAILKWTGDKQDPFKFEVVASGLKSEPAFLTLHEGHIISAGWTVIGKKVPVGTEAEMYRSPEVPADGGLTAATADASNWPRIFKMSDLEPDPVVARSMNFGDLTSYKGQLLFSTYTYAGYPTVNAFAYYGKPADEAGRVMTYVNAERATSVMSMDDPGTTDQKVRLLYGDAKLPVYNTDTKQWVPTDNVLHQTPKFGPAGFGNRYNTYNWMWTQYKGSLYMGTFDSTSVLDGTMEGLNPSLMQLSPLTVDLLKPLTKTLYTVFGGADTWRFDDPNLPAVPENLNGFGNRDSNGVRAWGAFPEQNKLLVGMATWANLKNGWKLNQLQG